MANRYSNITNKEIVLREIQKERHSIQDLKKAVVQKDVELSKKESELEKRQQKINLNEKELKLREKQLTDKLEKYNNIDKNITELADLYSSMRPEDATKRLVLFDDILIIDIFRKMITMGNKRIVTRILSLLDAPRSSEILRKMGKKRIELKK